MAKRLKPNILVTGTPGTGKTTTCELIASATGLEHVNIGDLVKAESLHQGWDDEFQCFIIDEDKVRIIWCCFGSAALG
jgi:adenylate kinase